MHRAQLARNGLSRSPRHGAASGSTKSTARHKPAAIEHFAKRSSLSATSESAKQISGEQEEKADEQCLEAVGAHDRDGDMGVVHQECEDGKQR
jgi:hypothetical protein